MKGPFEYCPSINKVSRQARCKRLATERLGLSAIVIAAAILLTACASSRGIPRPFPVPGGQAERLPSGNRTPVDQNALVDLALRFRGTPYRNGGADPAGFDCSGFTQYVFARQGVSLPRDVHDQFEIGRAVKRTDIAPADLIFFTTTDPGASHVGIAVNADEFVHAPSSNGIVRVERLSASYWSSRFVGARRLP
jgi:hypothetical protein